MNKLLYGDIDLKTCSILEDILNNTNKRYIILPNKRRNTIVKRFEKIKNIYNAKIVKYLLVFCFDKDFTFANKALKHLKRIIENLTNEELMFFAEYIRKTYYYYYIDSEIEKNYRDHNKYKFNLINRFGKDGIYILTILTLHSNGYIRQNALNKLSDFKDGIKIKFLMLRINDWVKHIRVLAKQDFTKCIKNEYLEDIIQCFPIINRMDSWGRTDSSDILLKLDHFIKDKKNYDLLLKIYINSEGKIIKRKLFKYLLEMNTTTEFIVNVGLKSKDIIVLKTAIEKINEIINKDNAELIYNALIQNKNVLCKLAVIDVLDKMDVSNLNEELIPLLYDKSYTVRDFTRDKLMKRGIRNFRERYLAEIDRSNYKLYGIISGIKETGVQEDSKVILKYLNHSSIKIRKTVLTTIYRLNSEEESQYALDKLTSDNMSESNTARKCLEDKMISLGENKLFNLFNCRSYKKHVYTNIICIINHYPKWIAITQLLKMLEISADDYIPAINHQVELWITSYNTRFSLPTKEQIDNIRDLFVISSNKLNNNNKIEIEDIIIKL